MDHFFGKNTLLALVASCWLPIHTWAASSKPRVNPTPSEIISKSKAGDWRTLDPENTLYLELESGRVVMELNSDFAPKHVENIKKLARSGYWDGLAILRSQDNYVVSWGDPGSMKSPPQPKGFKKGIAKSLKPEFERPVSNLKDFFRLVDGDVYADHVGFHKSYPVGWDSRKTVGWLLHCYGIVGVARGEDLDSGSGSALYVVTGHAPRHLDRNITLVGQVVDGISLLSALPRGTKDMGFYAEASQYPKIFSVKVAADMPKEERTDFEILKTSSKVFKDYTESRRNRPEKWFHRPAGKIGVCNARPPVRKKK